MSGAVPPLSCVSIFAAYPSLGIGIRSAFTFGVRLLKSSVNALKRSISPGFPQVDHLMLTTAPPAGAGACAAPAAVVGYAADWPPAVGCPPPAEVPPPLPLPLHAASAIPAMPAAARPTNLRRLTNVGALSELIPHSSQVDSRDLCALHAGAAILRTAASSVAGKT